MKHASSPLVRRLCAMSGLALCLCALPGCNTTGTGTGGSAVAYKRGELEANLPKDYDAVFMAARRAIKELEFTPISENKDALKAVLVARTGLDKKVEITLINSGKRLTNIKIRVGVFGDEQLSPLILDRIKAGW